MALTDLACRAAKTERLTKLSDGGGLQLWVYPGGGKLWRYAYRFGGKQKLIALGSYPLITLASARAARDAAKRLLIDGIDPAEARREDRAQKSAAAQTFGIIADEYLEKLRLEGKAAVTVAKNKWILDFAKATLAERAITSIKPADLLPIFRKLEARRRFHTAHRLRSTIGSVFRYAIATARAEHDPTIALRSALISYKETPRPAITDAKKFGALLRAIDGYDGHLPTKAALKLMALLFPRPGELRQARWSEFNLDEALWTIPPERMKGRIEHHVPLPGQAVDELLALQKLTGAGELVFPISIDPKRPLSENTINAALRRLGYDTKAEHSAHGFRSTASTLLNESGKWHPDAIERQLAHVEENAVRRVYTADLSHLSHSRCGVNSLDRIRVVTCPACGHEGVIDKHLPGSTKLKCRACGERMLARHCIGDKPCRWRRPSPEAAMKAAAVKEVLSRYGGGELLDDDLHDLFRGEKANRAAQDAANGLHALWRDMTPKFRAALNSTFRAEIAQSNKLGHYRPRGTRGRSSAKFGFCGSRHRDGGLRIRITRYRRAGDVRQRAGRRTDAL